MINREKYFNDITNRNLEKRAVKIAQFKLRISIESQKILFLPRSPKKHLHFSNVNSSNPLALLQDILNTIYVTLTDIRVYQ